jgi:hypothetical protein
LAGAALSVALLAADGEGDDGAAAGAESVLADAEADALVAAFVASSAADCAVAVAVADAPRADPSARATDVVSQAKTAVSSAPVTASQIERGTRRSVVPDSGNPSPKRTLRLEMNGRLHFRSARSPRLER